MATSIIDEIRDDSSAVYRFIDSICAPCAARQGAYTEPSNRFFDYITELGEKTKSYLGEFPKHVPSDPDFQRVYRQKLTILRDCWSELHRFVKPSIDADTLNVPFPLLAVLYNRLNTVPQFQNVSFTVYHLHDVNYQQIRASWMRELTQKLVAHIPGAQPFPPDLGLIGIPFSQNASVFLNALIPHEIGHFVYQELGILSTLQPHLNAALTNVLASSASLPPEAIAWLKDRLVYWLEEIFCDLFAVWLVGPAYVFAFIEIFDLMRLSYAGPASSASELEFNVTHPADAFRLSQQIALLDKLSWWSEVKKFKTHYVRVLEYVAGLSFPSYTFPSPFLLAGQTLEAFGQIVPQMIDIVADSVGGALDPGIDEFKRFNGPIEDALHHGVVPSSVLVDGNRHHPNPIAILNSAFKLSLESLDTLIEKIDQQDPALVGVRSRWLQRLEMWTMKSFEDYVLISSELE